MISNQSSTGPGLHGRPGFVASWRPIHINKPAVRVGGSPFKTFVQAEQACEALVVALLIYRECLLRRSNTVALSNGELGELGISRYAKYRALACLREAGVTWCGSSCCPAIALTPSALRP